MQNLLRPSRMRRATAPIVVCLAILGWPAPGHAQNQDRPIVTGGRTIGIAPPKEEDDKPAVDRRIITPDGKTGVRETAPLGATPSLIFTIDVRWLAASPYRIERDVTMPIEQAVKTLPGVRSVRSSVTGSRAQTLVTFGPREDASTQATAIRNRLDQIKRRLPRDASQPLIGWRRDPPV